MPLPDDFAPGDVIRAADINAIKDEVANASGTYVALTGAQTVAGVKRFDDPIQFKGNASAMRLEDTLGLNGRRLRLAPADEATGTSSASLEIVPAVNADPATQCTSQIILYNKQGADYERFAFSCVANEYVIDSTVQGAGTVRNIVFKAGTRNGIILYSDAAIDLNGQQGTTKVRIADPANAGNSTFALDTRTTTPADNAADYNFIEFRRGGTAKWQVGLNYNGANADRLDFYGRSGGGGLVLTLGGGATPLIGFFGASAVAKPTGVAVTAAGIHAALVTLGLIAA